MFNTRQLPKACIIDLHNLKHSLQAAQTKTMQPKDPTYQQAPCPFTRLSPVGGWGALSRSTQKPDMMHPHTPQQRRPCLSQTQALTVSVHLEALRAPAPSERLLPLTQCSSLPKAMRGMHPPHCIWPAAGRRHQGGSHVVPAKQQRQVPVETQNPYHIGHFAVASHCMRPSIITE